MSVIFWKPRALWYLKTLILWPKDVGVHALLNALYQCEYQCLCSAFRHSGMPPQVLICCSVLPFTCRVHTDSYFHRDKEVFVLVQISISAWSHAAGSRHVHSGVKSLAKYKSLHFPSVMHSLRLLWLPTQLMQTVKKSCDSTHSSWSPTPTTNDLDLDAVGMCINYWAEIRWLDGQQKVAVNALQQNFLRTFSRELRIRLYALIQGRKMSCRHALQ